ncbi:MAG: PAS domain S-box protein, partial [Comamonadaceae bacterium]
MPDSAMHSPPPTFAALTDAPLEARSGHAQAQASQQQESAEFDGVLSAAALRESDESYRTLFESMDDGFCILEMIFDAEQQPIDYRFIETNGVFDRQTGLKNAKGRTARELVPGLEAVWFERYGKVALTGEPLRFVEHSKPMGRWFDVAAFRTGNPSRGRVALIFNDITARRVAEIHQGTQLRLADRLRDLTSPEDIIATACEEIGQTLEGSLVGYGLIDEARQCVTLSGGWGAMDASALNGATLHFGDYGNYFGDLLAQRAVSVPDVRLDARTLAQAERLAQDGIRAFVSVPIFEGGRFVAVFFVIDAQPHGWTDAEIALIREVAERTRLAAERARANLDRQRQAQALHELNANLERLVSERTADRNALWQLSQDIMLRGTFEGRITAVNPAWTELLGWREDELLGSIMFDLVHPEDRAATMQAAAELGAGRPHVRIDNRYRAKDGTYRWINWSAQPGDALINAVGRDVTAEKEATAALHRSEEALRQSQKMEAVGQLTGGLAHDFNNLLTGVSGALELMQRRLHKAERADLERYIGMAQGATRRAAALTHRLLAFSRRQTLDPKPTDANRVVASMEELLRRTIGPAIALQVTQADDLWPTYVDAFQFENAVLNLCLNARDALPEGGQITISTANRSLTGAPAQARELAPGDYVEVRVVDNGTGMAPDVVQRAFEPFFTTKPIGQGTGLGLSMIYGFVRQSGGQVQIESEVGVGTTIHLYLPRHDTPEAAAEEMRAPTEAERSQDGETVLVIDDEPTVRL